jgi:allophanate hydrolase
VSPSPEPAALLAVCGAHLRGQPLHPVLQRLGAELVQVTSTAPVYQMVLIPQGPDDVCPRPGLIRRRGGGGGSLEVEVYRLAVVALGPLLVTVTSPLAIGSLVLADGSTVLGFVCEAFVDEELGDITRFGGWRGYLAAT